MSKTEHQLRLCSFAELGGFLGVIAGLTVAAKQVMPDHELVLFGRFKLKVTVRLKELLSQLAALIAVICTQYLPGIVVLLGSSAAYLLKSALPTVPFLIFGAYSAWLYLRFFQARLLHVHPFCCNEPLTQSI